VLENIGTDEASTMDPVIQNAIRRRSELRNELRDIERFLELYQQFKAPKEPRQMTMEVPQPDVDSVEQEKNTAPDLAVVSAAEAEPGTELGDARLTREALKPHIHAVIMEAGRPLTRGQILLKLDTRDVRVGGKYDRSKNMGTILWRLRDDFVNLAGRGYWPRNLAFPEAGYDPDDQNSPEAIDLTLRQEEPRESSEAA
jgi:hypothetical protein